MMESRTSLKSVVALAIIGLCISNGFAGLVDLSDSYYHESSETTFSFVVRVDYEVHDIGGGQYEARFQLEHLGAAAGGDTSMDIGRFVVFSEDPVAIGSISDPELVAPVWIYPVTTWSDRARYDFDPDFIPGFADEDVSEWLTLTFNAADMPQSDIVIEIDGAAYGDGGDTFITLAVPEPATLLLLGSGMMLMKRRKR
jgi:hypothetical protein